MSDLTTKRPATLAKLLEAAQCHHDVTSHAVFELGAYDEKYSAIIARLGASHPAVIANDDAMRIVDNIRGEARRRYGPAVSYDSMWVTFLRCVKT